MKKNNGQWLFYLGLAILLLGVAGFICLIISSLINNELMFEICAIFTMIAGPVSILVFIAKLLVYGGEPIQEPKTPKVKTYKYNEKDIPIVDVKEFKKSQDELMYEKYVDLYNKKIITKEDLEKKRVELLGK